MIAVVVIKGSLKGVRTPSKNEYTKELIVKFLKINW